MRTMVRCVPDDFCAMLMCNAMERCGGKPFSVVYVPRITKGYAGEDPAVWHVFGQVEDPDAVDALYETLKEPA